MRAALLISLLLLAPGCKQPPQKGPLREVTASEKGFDPSEIQVAPGESITLRFTRKSAHTCADAVEVQGDPVRHMLPLDVPIDVKVTAPASGEITFACPMNMFRGTISVVAGH